MSSVNIKLLSHHIATMYERVSALYDGVGTAAVATSDLLPVALKELGLASEELQVVMEELSRNNEQLIQTQINVQGERQRYYTLFEFAPDAHLITDTSGVIQDVNRAASTLLNRSQAFLLGQRISDLVAYLERSMFQIRLSQLAQRPRIEFTVQLHRLGSDYFDTRCIVDVLRDQAGNKLGLYWRLHEASEPPQSKLALENGKQNLYQNRQVYSYEKGEVIPLDAQTLFLVVQGVVKLTTLSDRGADLLVGLAQEEMVFGVSLTSLQTYQATALTDAQVISIPLIELTQSPQLAQAVLPLITQRLRQTERFLMISGQLRVEDRINHLLELLAQELGQPCEAGVRLRARLTHQDFANACCTTRVTITRLLGKLQQQGKVALDPESHLILKDMSAKAREKKLSSV